MDFAGLLPEINSARIYTGPGSGPLLAAAAAWDWLATELDSAAASYGSVVSALTSGPWLGPSSASMAAAAAPYVGWLSATASRAEQTANQARAAVAAYETAYAMTVPPQVIAANRAQLMALVATNLLGQNTPAIAATEAQYAEARAQDAAAMYSYAGASSSATTLPPFTPPAPSANPAVLGGHAAGVTQASPQLLSAVPQALQSLAAPFTSTSATTGQATSGLSGILTTLGLSPVSGADSGLSSTGLATASAAWGSASQATSEIRAAQVQMSDTQVLIVATQDLLHGTQDQMTGMEGRILARLGSVSSASLDSGAGPAALSAGLGRAVLIGGLSVPQGWAVAAPAIRPVALTLPVAGFGAAAGIGVGGPGNLFAEMALATMAGRAIGDAASIGRPDRGTATSRTPAMPAQTSLGGSVTGIAAELRELAELRDAGILTEEEFSEQKRRLLCR
ncbi:PPE domain-containing protein [Mycobacterium sp.]|uniref:PPE family protein, SVP subgroup n=1 Tax=Mycobacterium sp. TaxID=1785 RepID=UPI0012803431|nr:PPE domain-containing protein [Mycobacterium sp.]KAA8962459.1 MAG: PPE domain-containing protein [Mycobacterium sp.]